MNAFKSAVVGLLLMGSFSSASTINEKIEQLENQEVSLFYNLFHPVAGSLYRVRNSLDTVRILALETKTGKNNGFKKQSNLSYACDELVSAGVASTYLAPQIAIGTNTSSWSQIGMHERISEMEDMAFGTSRSSLRNQIGDTEQELCTIDRSLPSDEKVDLILEKVSKIYSTLNQYAVLYCEPMNALYKKLDLIELCDPRKFESPPRSRY